MTVAPDAEQDQQKDRHPDAGLPLVYVPRGKVALKEAVIRLAERHEPSLPIRRYLLPIYALPADPLRTLSGKTDPYAWPVSEPWEDDDLSISDRVRSFIALVNAREEMRQALAERDIRAVGQIQSGELVEVPNGYWRTDAGGDRLRFPDKKDDFEQVFFDEKILTEWIQMAPEGVIPAVHLQATTKGEPETRAWLTRVLPQPGAILTSKSSYRSQAMTLHGVSPAGFDRIWEEITKSDPDLAYFRKAGRKPGRKSTSPN